MKEKKEEQERKKVEWEKKEEQERKKKEQEEEQERKRKNEREKYKGRRKQRLHINLPEIANQDLCPLLRSRRVRHIPHHLQVKVLIPLMVRMEFVHSVFNHILLLMARLGGVCVWQVGPQALS